MGIWGSGGGGGVEAMHENKSEIRMSQKKLQTFTK